MIPIAKPAFAPLDIPPPLDEDSDPAVAAGVAELEVALMKEDVDEGGVDEVDIEEDTEDVVDWEAA